ncbi:MAG: SWIM zinc finger family protein [Candidatus Micrarchaeota archaeon]|nr:SWIM zinc finger family protein [Candidatus Micrarchaeota archaeon]
MSRRGKGPRPLLYDYDEVKGRALFMDNRRKVVITGLGKGSVEGFVKSESRKGKYHRTTIRLDRNRIAGGTCTCESVSFYGEPCKHMLKLRNSAVWIGIA